MENPFDLARKFKIFDELFLVFGNNKFVVKDLNKPNEHQTMFFRNNGVLDVHKTIEGSKKEYESLGKIDLLKAVAKIVSNPNEMIHAVEQTIKCIKEVDFTEEEFEHLKVSPMMTKEEFVPLLNFNKKRVNLPLESINALNSMNAQIPWKNAKNKIKENAFVYDGDCPAGVIFLKDNRFLFLQIPDVKDVPFVQFLDKAFDEKFDENTDEKTNNLRKELMRKLMEQNDTEQTRIL